MELDRNALLVYLSNLRMLETVIHESNQKNNDLHRILKDIEFQKEKYEWDHKIASPPSLESIKAEGKLGCLFTGMLMFGIFLLVCVYCGFCEREFLSTFILIPAAILMFYIPIRKKINTKAKLKEYESDVARYNQEVERVKEDKIQLFATLDEKINNINQMQSNICTETQQFEKILEDAYSLNIIPLQFRNIQGIYYLYDYISTSNETLTTALMQANLESIKQKLDNLIELQGIMIIQQAQANQMIFEQNNRMLSSLQNVEQYSKIAAINSELSVRMQTKQLAFQAADFLLK